MDNEDKNKRYELFLNRWQLSIDPLEQHVLKSREITTMFSRDAIRSSFLLNGGALIAFPAFSKLVGSGFSEYTTQSVMSIVFFVFGLVLITVTSLMAYLAMECDSSATFEHINSTKAELKLPLASQEDFEALRAAVVHHDAERITQYEKYESRQKIALYTGVGSVVSFVVGVCFAAFVLLQTPTIKESVAGPSPAKVKAVDLDKINKPVVEKPKATASDVVNKGENNKENPKPETNQ